MCDGYLRILNLINLHKVFIDWKIVIFAEHFWSKNLILRHFTANDSKIYYVRNFIRFLWNTAYTQCIFAKLVGYTQNIYIE